MRKVTVAAFKWHALPMPPKTAALPKRWYGRQPETGHRSFCCRNCSKPLTSVRNGGTPPMNWQPRRRKILPLHSCGKSLRELQVVLPVSFYEKAGTACTIPLRSLTLTARCWASTGRHTFRTTISIRKNSTSPRRHRLQSLEHPLCQNRRGHLLGSVVSGGCPLHGSRRCRTAVLPTAIGSEPILEVDSAPHWQRCMQGHAAANLMPVIAANRIGTEHIIPDEENQQQTSSLSFYGTSFLTDGTGAVLQQLGRDEAGIAMQTYDLDELEEMRMSWGVFRDRRPEYYRAISTPPTVVLPPLNAAGRP